MGRVTRTGDDQSKARSPQAEQSAHLVLSYVQLPLFLWSATGPRSPEGNAFAQPLMAGAGAGKGLGAGPGPGPGAGAGAEPAPPLLVGPTSPITESIGGGKIFVHVLISETLSEKKNV